MTCHMCREQQAAAISAASREVTADVKEFSLESFMRIVILLALLLCAGCATVQGVANKPLSDGATHVFSSDLPTTLADTRRAMQDIGLKIMEDKPIEGGHMLVGESGASGWSWGEIVRAIVQPAKRGTSVRVVTERALATNVTAKMDYADEIFTKIGQRLGDFP
ncbi:MAG: hypothetical protein JWO87_3053 [Phycisphaerales bacterium]|nr:hypothetical protein [Phycisphaerales bacterium]